MNKLRNQCSLKDTTILKSLILENPELLESEDKLKE